MFIYIYEFGAVGLVSVEAQGVVPWVIAVTMFCLALVRGASQRCFQHGFATTCPEPLMFMLVVSPRYPGYIL